MQLQHLGCAPPHEQRAQLVVDRLNKRGAAGCGAAMRLETIGSTAAKCALHARYAPTVHRERAVPRLPLLLLPSLWEAGRVMRAAGIVAMRAAAAGRIMRAVGIVAMHAAAAGRIMRAVGIVAMCATAARRVA
eukprot:98566-Chlamydomonas_euryale.AAC.7